MQSNVSCKFKVRYVQWLFFILYNTPTDANHDFFLFLINFINMSGYNQNYGGQAASYQGGEASSYQGSSQNQGGYNQHNNYNQGSHNQGKTILVVCHTIY